MPFTPLHFGPTAALGWCFRKRIDWPALIFANVAVDLEPLAVWVFRLNAPEHGFFHSFAGGAIVAVVWAACYAAWKKRMGRPAPLRNVLLSSFLGVYSNVVLDSIAYAEVRLFWPAEGNPLHGLVAPEALVWVCGLTTLIAAALWARAAKGR